MKNVTITLEEKVASWPRVRAAEQETSVSRFIGSMLKEKMQEEESYTAAMQQYLSQRPSVMKPTDTRYPPREKLHER